MEHISFSAIFVALVIVLALAGYLIASDALEKYRMWRLRKMYEESREEA